MRVRGMLLSLITLAFVLPARPAGATDKCGGFAASETWTTAGSPYIVTCDVNFWSGATLTIQPGVTVKFNANTALQFGNGTTGGLNAVGTSTQRITFTANTVSPTAGYWQGIIFYNFTTAASQLKFADVFYAGGFSHGGIHVSNTTGAFPVIQDVKAENNAYAGIRVQGGSPSISNCTIRYNATGIEVGFGTQASSPSITATTISGNTGYALNIEAKVTLGTVSGLTINTNGTNAASVSGTVSVNTTWKSLGVPYILAAGDVEVNAAGSPVLTIPAGSTIKFNAGRQLAVGPYNPGGLQANGTTAQPIVFTANGSTTPGFWRFVIFYAQALPSSKISFATVSYAEKGVYFYNGPAATIDHVTFTSNLVGAAAVNSAPILTNCNFSSNTAGFNNESPPTFVNARFNWWNHLSGPSSAGPGTGQSVSTGVKFEPWLGTAASPVRFFTTFSLLNSTFNPQIGINANFSFATTPVSTASWTLRIYNGATLKRTITGSGSSGSPVWDGTNDGGTPQPNATYTYVIDCTDGTNAAAPLRGRVILNTALQLAVNSLTVLPAFFSPNADGVQDTTTLSGVATFDGATWTVNVKNSGGTTVRTATGPANPNISYTWDGKNGAVPPVVQPNGVYTLQLVVTDGTASVTYTPTVTLDKTAPIATLTAPAAGATLSNLFQSGSANVTVSGTASDANIETWWVEYSAGTSPPPDPAYWTSIATGSTSITSSTLTTWATLGPPPVPNAVYTLRLRVKDRAGTSTSTQRTETIANFSVAQNILEFNGAAGGTVQYTSIIPSGITGTLTETLTVKNLAGTTVKTVFSGTRTPGTYQNTWNGKNTSNVLQPDGPYFYVATFSNGTSAFTWDLTNQYLNDGWTFGENYLFQPPEFMPFNNNALAISYTLGVPLRMSMLFTPYYTDSSGILPTHTACVDPGSFCTFITEYQESGLHSYTWTGYDDAGVFRSDIVNITAIGDRATFSKNAVILFGSKPTFTNFQLQPPTYFPGSGNMFVTASSTSYLNEKLTETLKVTNHSSNSILRTVTQTNQSPGALSITWDGKADNGMLVAPGHYTIALTITDSRGQAVTKKLLAIVGY